MSLNIIASENLCFFVRSNTGFKKLYINIYVLDSRIAYSFSKAVLPNFSLKDVLPYFDLKYIFWETYSTSIWIVKIYPNIILKLFRHTLFCFPSFVASMFEQINFWNSAEVFESNPVSKTVSRRSHIFIEFEKLNYALAYFSKHSNSEIVQYVLKIG